MSLDEVRDASTVVLLRDGSAGVETWLLTRVSGMVFAGGMTVFPGGRVDEGDADLPFAGGAPEAAALLADDEATVRALLGAAVRETFEETGVLLTVPAGSAADAVADVEAGRLSFGDLLRSRDLAVDAAALRPWSRWVTPPGQTRRYDTRFFVAALPAGATAADVTTESSRAEWVPVGAAVEQAQRGERAVLPPTAVTLAALAEYESVAAVLAAASMQSLEAIRV